MNSLIAFDLDASSSMSAEPTAKAFNRFLSLMQTRQDDCSLYLATFDDRYTELVLFRSIFTVPQMSVIDPKTGTFDTELHYVPTGATLLYDSVALMVKAVTKHIESLPEDEKPQSVTLVVQTDGGNNRGSVNDHDVARIIHEVQRVRGWNVLFLADAVGFDDERVMKAKAGTYSFGSVNSARACGFKDDQIIIYNDPDKGFGDAAEAILESAITGKIREV